MCVSPTPRPACLQRSLAALLVLAALLAGCGRGERARGADDVAVQFPVEVALASVQRVSSSWTGSAALQAENEAQVVARSGGILLELLVEEGDAVQAGQVLARLDADRARLELERASANLRRLEGEFRRSQELIGRNLTSSEAHDRIRFELETQRAAVELARLELGYTEIRAPISGVIAERLVRVGNLIQPNQPVFRVVSFDPLKAVLNVPERELARLRPDQPVLLTADALPGETFVGRVARVSPVVDAGSGTFRVTAEFRDALGRLRAGMFGRIAILQEVREQALVIPREALIVEDGTSSVFVLSGDSVERRALRTGVVDGAVIEVLEGLAPGEAVVTVGRTALRDGSPVLVVNRERLEAEAKTVAERAASGPVPEAPEPVGPPAPEHGREPEEDGGESAGESASGSTAARAAAAAERAGGAGS